MKRGQIAVIVCLSVWVLCQLLPLFVGEHGHLAITNPHWSRLFEIAILLLPTVSLPWCVTAFRGWVRIVLLVLVTPIALISCFLAFCALIFRTDSDATLMKSLNVNGPPIHAYMIAGINYCAIAIRQERPLFPGVVWSHSLHCEDDSEKDGIRNPGDVTLTIVDKHHIRCTFFGPSLDGHLHTVILRID